ncbi:MAG: ABC transporter permease, partial [Acidobacteriota bacterium]
MSNILKIAIHDLRITLKDRSAVMWMFILPVVFATFFGLVFGGGSGSNPVDGRVGLTILDLDGSALSERLIDELKDDRFGMVFQDPLEAKAADTVRTLVIPEDFELSVMEGVQTTLRLEKEPDTSEEAALVAQARIIRSATRLIGGLIMTELSEAEGDSAVEGNFSEPTNSLVSIDTTWAGERPRPPSGFSQSIPGNATMFVLLVTLTYGAASIAGERHSGLLRRLLTSPVSRREIVGGKILGRFVISGLQLSVLVGFVALVGIWVDLDLGGSLLSLWAVLLIYGACVAPLGVALGAWFRDRDRASNIGVMMTMGMAAFGGCWWPLEVVSQPLQKFAMIFPTTWVMRALHGLISFGHDWKTISPFVGVLVLFGIV